MSNFWNKVAGCKHENLNPDYFEEESCGTPTCSGATNRCMDCEVYITECQCGYLNGMSGWSPPMNRNLGSFCGIVDLTKL